MTGPDKLIPDWQLALASAWFALTLVLAICMSVLAWTTWPVLLDVLALASIAGVVFSAIALAQMGKGKCYAAIKLNIVSALLTAPAMLMLIVQVVSAILR
jgi:hypothetical protein